MSNWLWGNCECTDRNYDHGHAWSLSSSLYLSADLDNWKVRVLQFCFRTKKPHKHLTEWFRKALLSTDRVKQRLPPLCQPWRQAFLPSVPAIVLRVGAEPLWPIQAEKRTKCQWLINAFYAARLRCTFRAGTRSMRFVIYLCWEWNTHFSGENIQLGLLHDAFAVIRLWYTLGEVQEGKSTTH